jgi:hypothetical protein
MAGGTNDTMAGVKRFDVKPANQAAAVRGSEGPQPGAEPRRDLAVSNC